MYVTTFTVIQTVPGNVFPMDMLRYDSCFPERSEDASEISTTLVGPMMRKMGEKERVRSVSLVRYHKEKDPRLTPERWRSFGWMVMGMEVKTRRMG